MKNAMALLALLAGMTFLGLDSACGQSYGSPYGRPQPQQNFYRPTPLQRPTVSPYLGLLRGGRNGNNNMGLNYFSVVRPEIQLRNELQNQQAEQNRLAEQLRAQQAEQQRKVFDPATQPGGDPMTGASRTLPPTGHSTSLMNLNGRFMTR